MIPYGRQSISRADIEAVEDILRSDFLTQGPTVPRFEAAVAERVGAAYGVAVNSATSALHVACQALGVGPGDEVWTSPITFVASANCALYCGADVDFVDVDPATGNMDSRALEAKLVAAAKQGRRPKIVIPVHYSGEPCDMAAIGALAERFGFAVVEDASHAIGGEYCGTPVGACEHSDIAVFSFHPVKIITSGEGGLATTQDRDLAERMALLRNHGITRAPQRMTKEPEGPWYYQQVELGFNYRLTDLQAALGLSQLQRIETFIDRRHELAARYDELLAGLPLSPLRRAQHARSALHLYVIQTDPDRAGRSRRAIFESLRADGIGVQVHYIPVHLQPFYTQRGFRRGDFPQAESFYERAISLPLYPDLSFDQQDEVVAALRAAVGGKET